MGRLSESPGNSKGFQGRLRESQGRFRGTKRISGGCLKVSVSVHGISGGTRVSQGGDLRYFLRGPRGLMKLPGALQGGLNDVLRRCQRMLECRFNGV